MQARFSREKQGQFWRQREPLSLVASGSCGTQIQCGSTKSAKRAIGTTTIIKASNPQHPPQPSLYLWW